MLSFIALSILSTVTLYSCTVAEISFNYRDGNQYPLGESSTVVTASNPLTFVALGDSFAAGPGAGNSISWWDYFNTCRRSTQSYPVVVNNDAIFSSGHTFDFRACTGAVMKNVMKEADGGVEGSQLDSATLQANITTLSIGGNDIGFFDILDCCVYHFGGWGSSEDCDKAIASAESTVKSSEFDRDLDLVINGVLNNTIGAPSPHLIITGYAQFFNAETEPCENMTFCIWENPTKNHTCPSLTRTLRRRLNSLTDSLNSKIGDAATRAQSNVANATVTFIDYDLSFSGHRFCEPEQDSPDFKNPSVWFYQTWGNAGEGHTPPDDDEPSYEDVDPETCLDEAKKSGDWGKLAVCRMARAKKDHPDLKPEPKDGEVESQDLGSWITPNQLARIFHPKIGGHHMIAEHILVLLNATSGLPAD